jgi:hypothetical protein
MEYGTLLALPVHFEERHGGDTKHPLAKKLRTGQVFVKIKGFSAALYFFSKNPIGVTKHDSNFAASFHCSPN